MKSIFALLLLLAISANFSRAQIVKTPDGPDLIDWKNDSGRMKKAKVKEVREYLFFNQDSVLNKLIEFDTSGYITNEVTYNSGKIYSQYEFEYHAGHHSYSRFTYEDGIRYCDWKNIPDRHGYPIQTSRGFSDGAFEESSSYYFSYKDNKLISAIGKNYHQKEERYYTYDKTGKLISAKEKVDSNPEWNWEYTYDTEGRLIKEYWWEKEGTDTSMVGWSKWTYDADGKIIKQEGKGRGWKDINYEWSGDTLKIDFKQGPEFGPSNFYVQQLSNDKKLVICMKKYSKNANVIEEKRYVYEFY